MSHGRPQVMQNCPVCMSHVLHSVTSECPGCGARLTEEVAAQRTTFGEGVSRALMASRSGALAATLGVTLTMSAVGCGVFSPPNDVYGGPPIEDMGEEVDATPAADMSEQPAPAPAYGAPPGINE